MYICFYNKHLKTHTSQKTIVIVLVHHQHDHLFFPPQPKNKETIH